MQILALRDFPNPRKYVEPKLSVIWRKASVELKQIKNGYGNARRKEACALGAIAYYASNGKTCEPSRIPISERLVYANMVARWERLSCEELSKLNDARGWSFQELAEKAAALGL